VSDRRAEIVEIASVIFARKGFASATVREIADEAGILSGSLYHHFDSKEAIAEAILSKYYSGMLEAYRKVAQSADENGGGLAQLIRVAFRGIAEQPSAVALIDNSGDLLLANERFAHLRAMNSELEALWLSVIRSEIERGTFKSEVDPRLVRRFIRDNLWVVIRWWKPDGRYSIEEVADLYIDLIYNGLLAQPRTESRRPSAATRARRRGPRAGEVTV
jgi:AcrR family transcriptional regulator